MTERPSRLHDVLGLGVTVVAVMVVLGPALWHGHSLGPFDLLRRWGLTQQPGPPAHNPAQSDQILLFAPVTDLVWHQVRAGHVPLWNSYNVLGVPLAFDWESAVFSLPMLLAYLVPVSFAYSMVVIVKLVIAGSGMYVLCRVLGLRPLSASLGATTFELCGNVIGYSGWPLVGVLCWFGWIFAFAVLLTRARHPVRDTVLLALSIAFAVYGGYPGSLVLLAGSLAVFFGVTWAWQSSRAPAGNRRDVGVALVRLLVAGVCGLGLAAPLLLPGVQTGLASSRRSAPAGHGSYALTHLPNLLASGLQGHDFRQATYIGVVGVVLVVLAVRFAWSDTAVRALALLAAGTMALVFLGPLDRLIQVLPGARVVIWDQAVGPMSFALAALAAFGFEHLLRRRSDPQVWRWALAGFVACGAVLAALYGAAEAKIASGVSPYLKSLIWPAVEVVGAGALVTVLVVRAGAPRTGALWDRLARATPPLVLGVNGLFLVVAGTGFWSSSSVYFATTPAVGQLARTVGDGLVGFGSCNGTGTAARSAHEVGIHPDANIAYAVREFGVYDPILQTAYYRSWSAASGVSLSAAFQRLGLFCARITTASQARLYGITYVLEPAGHPGPAGTIFERLVADEGLYRVPSSGRATLGTGPPDQPGVATVQQPVPVVESASGSWRMALDAPMPGRLWLRLSAEPGWRATVDGRAVPLGTWDDQLMLDLPVPAGHHVVALRYWPPSFTVGIAVAAGTALVLVLAGAVAALGRRSRSAARAATHR